VLSCEESEVWGLTSNIKGKPGGSFAQKINGKGSKRWGIGSYLGKSEIGEEWGSGGEDEEERGSRKEDEEKKKSDPRAMGVGFAVFGPRKKSASG